ncbi:hypothetical protein JTB14_005019 [Gonioctena quinquepunctata]|nr:hypothetical protein JTB14_005019 [Gonioctena quinquepunctata]
MDPNVIHAPRKVFLPCYKKLKERFGKLQNNGMVKKVEEPTEWVNSIVLVRKRNGYVRSCLDLKNLGTIRNDKLDQISAASVQTKDVFSAVGADSVNPSNRRDSIPRTPPKAIMGEVNPENEFQEDREDTFDTSSQKPKRKRSDLTPDTPEDKREPEIENFRRTMATIFKQAGLLEKVISDSYKPKKELTDISSRLKYHIGQLQKKEQKRWLDRMTSGEKDTERSLQKDMNNLQEKVKKLEHESETAKKDAKMAKKTEQSLRKEIEQLQEKVETLERDTQKPSTEEKIKETLSTEKTFQNLAKIIDEKWPEEIYKVVHLRRTNIHQGDLEEDLAVFVDPDKTTHGETYEVVRNQYPPICPLMEEGLEEGVIDFVKMQIGYMSSRRREEKENYSHSVFLLPMTINGSGVDDAELMLRLCIQLRHELENGNRNEIRIGVLGKTNLEYFRKCVEFALRGLEIKATLCIEENNKTPRRKSERDKTKRDRHPVNDKIIIKTTEGKSYADLLRSVKDSVDLEEKGIQIRAMRKTNKGDLIMEVSGGNAMDLKRSIQEKNQNTNVVIKTDEITIHITDIDASIDENELKCEIMKSKNILENHFRIISIRPTQSGNQIATIAMNRKIAEEVTNTGKIKIGLGLEKE